MNPLKVTRNFKKAFKKWHGEAQVDAFRQDV